MSEFGIRVPEALYESTRLHENEREELLREEFLEATMFHPEYMMSEKFQTPGQRVSEMGRIQAEFLREKRGKDMRERFEMALSDKYLGKLHVVELGMTSNPGASGEVDGLKSEYHTLRDYMVSLDMITEELSREKSGRTVGVRAPQDADARGKLVIMTRNRPLMYAELETNNRRLELGVAKRMVFSLPTQALHALASRPGGLNEQGSLEILETMLSHGSGGVKPIRTGYYLITNLE